MQKNCQILNYSFRKYIFFMWAWVGVQPKLRIISWFFFFFLNLPPIWILYEGRNGASHVCVRWMSWVLFTENIVSDVACVIYQVLTHMFSWWVCCGWKQVFENTSGRHLDFYLWDLSGSHQRTRSGHDILGFTKELWVKTLPKVRQTHAVLRS